MEIREMFFRGKTTTFDGGVWIEGALIIESYGEYELYHIDPYFTGNTSDEDCRVVIEETVGQYTGVIDKNGRKVFEGDIVRVVRSGDGGDWELIREIKDIRFLPEELFGSSVQEVEVIGKIYDNL